MGRACVARDSRSSIDMTLFRMFTGSRTLVLVGTTEQVVQLHELDVHESYPNPNETQIIPRTSEAANPCPGPVSYTHLRAHETPEHLVCRLLLEKKKKKKM
eukprot:TRINITY_DN5557_c0_g1_i9.p1 TRINITY_DN5557_c0_g1~~TRINITY_DN5557_c0_g1_i9.p1  ORF type:complete len:101 (-),score=14.51 TRINITY_DN5557_c0_g1_i9:75-377(-)